MRDLFFGLWATLEAVHFMLRWDGVDKAGNFPLWACPFLALFMLFCAAKFLDRAMREAK